MNYGRRKTDYVSHERWLVSYADFVTLLFAFFVVMYASAELDRAKAARLSEAIASGFQQMGAFQPENNRSSLDGALASGSPAVSLARLPNPAEGASESLEQKVDLAALRAALEKALAAEMRRNEVAMHMEPDGLVVSLREMGFFGSGSADLKSEAGPAFARIAQILIDHPCGVRIEGHTDTIPIHTAQFASNWELSTARATEIVKLLIEQHGLPPERLSAAGYGEFHPVASNDSAQGRQVNRRVDIVLLAKPLKIPIIPVASLPSSDGGPKDRN